MRSVRIGDWTVGEGADRLTLIAGPCVVESLDLCLQIAAAASQAAARAGFHYVFKASFDKANRTSASSFRGPGMEAGLAVLEAVRRECGAPVLTDLHEPWQAEPVARVADVLQIPAFLCRQTDLLVAAARTGKVVNVKKGQFVAPWDLRNTLTKLEGAGGVILTERGAAFGYNTLVVDMCALPQMRALGVPVCFDATHSVQQPSGAGGVSGGRREFVPHLARAAAAVGIDALFLEIHPEPERALSDAATMLPLAELEPLLRQVRAVHEAARAAAPGADARPAHAAGATP
ncbi:MAG TPA: 3-deoxy-8-phosphooctulonate synthase [Chthonomonadales bacterium]|nr:3-deoxy-8-phosphooctulonate synthase [Chthonomonadales bacterium]